MESFEMKFSQLHNGGGWRNRYTDRARWSGAQISIDARYFLLSKTLKLAFRPTQPPIKGGQEFSVGEKVAEE
jgi:hypothetical protein